MGAALEIADADVVQLAGELAELRKVSVRGAVASALRRGLDHECETARRHALLMEIAADIRSDMDDPIPSSDHSWLYDDNGLPV